MLAHRHERPRQPFTADRAPAPPPPATGRHGAARRAGRRDRGAACVSIPALISYASAMLRNRRTRASASARSSGCATTAPAGSSTGSSTIYYSLNAPSTGGPALHALPRPAGRRGRPDRAAHHVATTTGRRHRPVIHPALPRRGRVARDVRRTAARIRRCSSPASARRPELPADGRRRRLDRHSPDHHVAVPGHPGAGGDAALAAGPRRCRRQCARSSWRRSTAASSWPTRVAGSPIGGHTYAPMQAQMATIVRYRNGRDRHHRVDGGPNVGPDVVYARQNLPLIVNHGRPNPNLSDGPEWGATLGNAIHVWRSAVGIDRRGNLIYAASP